MAVPMRSFVNTYSGWSKSFPLSVAFFTCWVKGSLSDVTSQKLIENKNEINWRRCLAFGFFSGAYLGCGQHWVYNVWFTRWFGEGNSLKQVAQRVVADSLIHTPCMYLPLYYMFENAALGGSAQEGLSKYFGREGWESLTTYWSMWPMFHAMNFRFNRPELRIAAIAGFSYLWLIVLSFISHQSIENAEEVKEGQKKASAG